MAVAIAVPDDPYAQDGVVIGTVGNPASKTVGAVLVAPENILDNSLPLAFGSPG